MSAALRLSSKHLRPSSTRCSPALASRRQRSCAYATSSSDSQLLADKKAEEFHNLYKGTATNGGETKLYIDGQFESSQTKDWIELHDPVGYNSILRLWGLELTNPHLIYVHNATQSTQRVLTKVPKSTQSEMTRAVDAAENAFHNGWKDSSILSRQRIMMK